ncbi:uncharacterized protein LOC123701420 [Colias croceus]|uniref:uncharacterized protein LOC123701420 n=1 Tax=Colias crocea TaxID=72248 RepID=UPI001E27E29B|nr:uncharacterized protein LOC123701420 [Colias croceus]
MLTLSLIVLIIPAILSLPQKEQPCAKALHRITDNPDVILIPDKEDDEIDYKFARVRKIDNIENKLPPRYAVITGKNGNVALVNIGAQWPLTKHVLGNSNKWNGLILKNTNIPLKTLLAVASAENYPKNLFSNTKEHHHGAKVSDLVNYDWLKQFTIGTDGWGSHGTSME